MTNDELNGFRNVLEAAVAELNNSMGRREEIHIEGSADALDRTLRAAERELAVQNLEAIAAKQRLARAALRRIREGTYGTCLECQEAITLMRLAAMPWAALCIQCQGAVDYRCAARNARPALAMAA
jgi:DnaK suppressor protein